LQRPVAGAGAVAVWIGVDVVGLDAVALLVDPGVVIGAGIFSDESRVGGSLSRPAIADVVKAAHTVIVPGATLNFTLTPTFELPQFAQTAARKIVTGYHPRLDATGQELLRAKGRLRHSPVACARVGYGKLP
jgi:hypothetical protein